MGLIRFLLACTVVLCHTSPIFGYTPIPSALAVQSFYLISGFYMSLILNEKYPKGANLLFYKNRALKIFPVYWVILLLLIASSLIINYLGHPGTISIYKNAFPLALSTWLFVIIINIFIIGYELSFYLNLKNGHLAPTKNYGNSYVLGFNSIAWTISIELAFYLIAPFIVRKPIFLPLILLLISLATRVVLSYYGLSHAPWDYMFFPTQLMFFMGGYLSYKLYDHISKLRIRPVLMRIQYAALLIVILTYSYVSNNNYYHQAVLFLCLIAFIPVSFKLCKNNSIDKYLGNLSYPLYISQYLIITFTVSGSFPKVINLGFTTLMLTIILSVVLFELIIKPIERRRQKPFEFISVN